MEEKIIKNNNNNKKDNDNELNPREVEKLELEFQ